ncbi:MAG: amidohydrolase, partial [Thermoanaerobaculia bacterium]|nr:amidohydrolase [Thermoanaerobaculia bacterium]
ENSPLDAREITGLYRFDVDGVERRLHLTKAAGKLEGTLGQGEEEKVVLSGVTDAGSSVVFRSAWGSVEDGGVARFSVARVGEALRGTVTLPDGRTLPLDLEPLSEEEPADEAIGGDGNLAANDYLGIDEDEEEEDAPLVSRTTFPPLPFGFEELPRAETVLVRNATLWTLDANGTLEGDLLVRDGKIAAVGVDLELPSGAREIDGTGKHVTPGIIDEHSHVGISGGVNEGSHSVTAEVRIGDVVNPDHVGIYRALGGGVTTIQQLHGSANPIGGQAQIIKLRWGQSAEAMKFEGAPPSIKFALGENVKQSNWGSDYTIRYPQSRMGVETIMRDAFVAAREYAASQRAYRDLSDAERRKVPAPRRDLQLEALVEILDSTRFIHCHSYVQSEISMLMRLADELGFKVQTFTHILEGYKVAAEMAEHGAGGSTFSDWWAYKFEVYDAIPQNMCIMNDAGIVTSVNSDSAEHMRRLNQEAAKAVMYCGMDENEALAMATLNPAKQLRIDDRVGSLTPGKDADFVIWNGHPLSVYSTPEQTWIDGTLYFSRTRDAELRARDATEREALIQKLLADEAPKAKEEAKDEGGDEMAKSDGDPAPEATQEWQCDTMEDIWND